MWCVWAKVCVCTADMTNVWGMYSNDWVCDVQHIKCVYNSILVECISVYEQWCVNSSGQVCTK